MVVNTPHAMPPSLHSQLTQSTQIAKALIRVRILPHLAHTPGAADDGLIAGAHVAIAEGHEPRERRIFCERCRRPIEGQLDISERMALRKGWIKLCCNPPG